MFDFFCGCHKSMTLNTLTWNNFKFFCFKKQIMLEKLKLKKMQIFLDYLCDNAMFKSSMFPNSLKLVDVTPLHKKGRKVLKENNGSVSILSTLSKNFEIIMFAQIFAFFDYVFSKWQCRFRKGYSIQHCKLKMLRKWKKYGSKWNFINRPFKGIWLSRW